MKSKDPYNITKDYPEDDWARYDKNYNMMMTIFFGGRDSSPQKTVEKSNFSSDTSTGGPGGGSGKNKNLLPGSTEHKAARWEEYQKSGRTWEHGRWSKQYDTNMKNSSYGLERENLYRKTMGGENTTLKTVYTNRQIDIFNAKENYAGQLKTGKVSLNKENILAIKKDEWLVDRGYNVEHILEKGASQPYLNAFDKAGVDYRIGPQIT